HLCIFFLSASPSTAIYTLSLHDALPIFLCHLEGPRPSRPWLDHPAALADPRRHRDGTAARRTAHGSGAGPPTGPVLSGRPARLADRKSTRLNSSHVKISYAVFCLKKKTT